MGYFTLLLRKTKTYLSPTTQSHHFFHLRCQKTKPSLPPISGYILKSISKFYSLFNFFHFFHHLILLMKFYISNFGRLLLAFVRGVLNFESNLNFLDWDYPNFFVSVDLVYFSLKFDEDCITFVCSNKRY